MKMNAFIIFNWVLILVNIEKTLNGICGTDKLKIKPISINVPELANKNLLNADTYKPIAIGYDFSTLTRPSSMSTTIFSKIKTLLKETREEFSKFLKIKHLNVGLSNQKDAIMQACFLETISDDYENFYEINDIIIFPMFDSNLRSSTLAAAAPCLIVRTTNRPLAGIVYINTNINFGATNTDLYLKNILLHEISHILAFHPSIFSALKMNQTIDSVSYIVSSKVLAKAREHFGCSSLAGVPLENQGGVGSVGSHWESRYMLGDYMISSAFPDEYISDISLALFEDTGFYQVNYYSGGLFKFGKNKGCDFFNKKCIEDEKAIFEEFCDTQNAPQCSSSRTTKSSCYITTYTEDLEEEYQYFSDPKRGGIVPTNYCPVPYQSHYSTYYFPNHCQVGRSTISSEYGETIGDESFCFISSLLPSSSSTDVSSQIAICYEIECDTSNSQIIIKIGSGKVTCPTNGGSISNPSGFKGTIECPAYTELCSSNNDPICNEMYDCFDELAEKDNYNYETTYDDAGEDDTILPVSRSESYNIKMNLSLFILILLLFTN